MDTQMSMQINHYRAINDKINHSTLQIFSQNFFSKVCHIYCVKSKNKMCLWNTDARAATKSKSGKIFQSYISTHPTPRGMWALGLRGAPKISVLRGSHCTVRDSIREFRISVRFVLHIALSKQQWWRLSNNLSFEASEVNDIVSYLWNIYCN